MPRSIHLQNVQRIVTVCVVKLWLLHVGRHSSASVGPSMSLGNWLPVEQNHLVPKLTSPCPPQSHQLLHLRGAHSTSQLDVALQHQQMPTPQSFQLPHVLSVHSMQQPDVAVQAQQEPRLHGRQTQTMGLISNLTDGQLPRTAVGQQHGHGQLIQCVPKQAGPSGQQMHNTRQQGNHKDCSWQQDDVVHQGCHQAAQEWVDVAGRQLQQVEVSQQLSCQQLKTAAQVQGNCSVKRAADRRRQCLLEIERELMRNSSSDEEDGKKLHFPKRQKTTCTGDQLPRTFLLSTYIKPAVSACSMLQLNVCVCLCAI